MEKKALAFMVSMAMLLILVLNMACIKNVMADASPYTVEWVNHQVKILYDGYILVNETIRISGAAPNSLIIGFPYRYGPYVLRCIAYNAANINQRYDVTTGVPLGDRIGFYGVNVTLNQPMENATVTVIVVLSNSLLRQNTQNTTLYTLDFPAFPSLTVDASLCNASVILPSAAKYITGTSTVNATNYSLKPLSKFTYEPANLTFQLTSDDIQLFTVEEFKREISVGSFGEIEVSDSYYIRNDSPQPMTSVKVALPPNASNVRVKDEFGRKMTFNAITRMVSLSLPVENDKLTRFIVTYNLPQNASKELSFIFFQEVNYYIKKAWITITLPEGAKILHSSPESASTGWTYGVARDVFKEKITANMQGILSLDNFTIKVTYEYNSLWLAFRPTLWVWAMAVLGCAIVAVWKRPKAPEAFVVPAVAVRLSPVILRKFVDSYEEKRRITSEIKSLEVAVSKGRIPRQRYKVQRKTLETRLAALSRSLDDLKLRLRSAGGRYADLMRQLEVAETEINEVESNIKSIEARHRRGELTREAYRKLLADYESRREKAETTISGILLRIREEIH